MKTIEIKGARENNLKNINLSLPRDKFIVFCGLSGSGKTTLAFDTIFAEGQRRYVESLSAYARQFLGQMNKPDVDSIDGLSPAVSIDQKTTSHNPRSTVGTVTEIYDYLRLLFARVGEPFCPNCDKPIARQTVDQIVDKIMHNCVGKNIIIKSPIIKGQKGTHQKVIEGLRKSGFARVEINGIIYYTDEEINLDKTKRHNISCIVDRIEIDENSRKRLADSVEIAIKQSGGLVVISEEDKEDIVFNTNFACSDCGFVIKEISPRLFSFNSPFGACDRCDGLGEALEVDEQKIVLANKSLADGAIDVIGFTPSYFEGIARKYNFSLNTPYKNLTKQVQDIILYGTNDGVYKQDWFGNMKQNPMFEGVINIIKRRFKDTTSAFAREEYRKLMISVPCDKCKGLRLNKEALSVKIGGLNIAQVCNFSIDKLDEFLKDNQGTGEKAQISKSILKEIFARLSFLRNVGLNYLTLSRSSGTISGGEAQRIRLATQIGSGLSGVLYILDEPSIGLHQRDNDRLIATLNKLKDLGNTLIVVEHDEETIRAADHIVDIGPKAGVHGGRLVAQGTVEDIINEPKSLTGQYLSGKRKIEVPDKRRPVCEFLHVRNAKQNNLKDISVDIPSKVLTCITGVSGSGKSSLIQGIVVPELSNKLNGASLPLGDGRLENIDIFDKLVNIDQSPIGRTPRSNPATYTGVWTFIRDLFAATVESKERGYCAGRFSFNVSGGRCEACCGDGLKKIEMFFLPDIYVPCEVCAGLRYNKETLEVKYKNKNISDVLDMTIEEALTFFDALPQIKNKLQAIFDVGLGYIKLGQSATTLSGGEAQRIKLALHLSKRSTGKTIYILDEPTTGLHFHDVNKLIKILQRLVDSGNTVVVVEHNLDVIKVADYIIDLGPEGGDKGGEVVANGTPEHVCKCPQSHTGAFLAKLLNK